MIQKHPWSLSCKRNRCKSLPNEVSPSLEKGRPTLTTLYIKRVYTWLNVFLFLEIHGVPKVLFTIHQVNLYGPMNKHIYGTGIGISTVFLWLCGHEFGRKGVRTTPGANLHMMSLDPRNKSINALGMGISVVFQIIGHLLFRGGQ